MKRSLNSPENNKDKCKMNAKLVFPDSAESIAKKSPVTLAAIIRSSEEMLPFENKRRQKSAAAFYTAFKLKNQ